MDIDLHDWLIAESIDSPIITSLIAKGFVSFKSFDGVKQQAFLKEIGSSIPKTTAKSLWKLVTSRLGEPKPLHSKTVASLLNASASSSSDNVSIGKGALQMKIITFCRSLDKLMGGGVQLGQITDICGTPGIGKSQLCMQLCVDVQINRIFGGVDGEAIFIDTEGTFQVDRIHSMAKALVNHLHKLGRSKPMVNTTESRFKNMTDIQKEEYIARKQKEKADALKHVTVENILKGIRVLRCYDFCELMSIINGLHRYLDPVSPITMSKETPGSSTKEPPPPSSSAAASLRRKVRLVVIDSIAFPIRTDRSLNDNSFNITAKAPRGDASKKMRVIAQIGQKLNKIVAEHQIAVVTTNHVTTNIEQVSATSTGNYMSHGLTAVSTNTNNLRVDTVMSVSDMTDSNGHPHALLSSHYDLLDTTNSTPQNRTVSTIVPALGKTWETYLSQRYVMYWNRSGARYVSQWRRLQGATDPKAVTPFQIKEEGIRDVQDPVMKHVLVPDKSGKPVPTIIDNGGGVGVPRDAPDELPAYVQSSSQNPTLNTIAPQLPAPSTQGTQSYVPGHRHSTGSKTRSHDTSSAIRGVNVSSYTAPCPPTGFSPNTYQTSARLSTRKTTGSSGVFIPLHTGATTSPPKTNKGMSLNAIMSQQQRSQSEGEDSAAKRPRHEEK